MCQTLLHHTFCLSFQCDVMWLPWRFLQQSRPTWSNYRYENTITCSRSEWSPNFGQPHEKMITFFLLNPNIIRLPAMDQQSRRLSEITSPSCKSWKSKFQANSICLDTRQRRLSTFRCSRSTCGGFVRRFFAFELRWRQILICNTCPKNNLFAIQSNFRKARGPGLIAKHRYKGLRITHCYF
jgi:hypothetical protein